nr:DUF334 domain-containing protein [Staphylococcus xylosus]
MNENFVNELKEQNAKLGNRMIELEQREQNRSNQNQKLVNELKASTSNFKNYLDKTETKVIKISNQMLSKIDTKHITEDVAKAFRQEKDGMYEDIKGIRMANKEQHEVLNNSLKENQKLNSTFKTSIKSMTHGIGALYFVILLMALVSIVTGPIGHVLGIDSMYSTLHHTITHTQSAWGYLWYIAYIVPYLLFVLILWGCLSLLRLFEK